MQNGHAYKTLVDAAVDGEAGCQDGYHTIPQGWQIAPHDGGTTSVKAAHTWSTSNGIVAGGSGWYSRYIHTWKSSCGEDRFCTYMYETNGR